MKPIKDFKNKTALVTGSSSGIGKQFARQLAVLGANLVITGRDEQRLQDAAGGIREDLGTGRQVEVITADLSKPESPQKLFDRIKEKNIHVDILVNNAGFGKWGKFEDEPYNKTFQMNMLNVVSLASMCHLFIPPMLEKGEGGVINVSSTAAFQPIPYEANYAATKAFVLSLSLALWQEYKDSGVIITALCPGFTNTNFSKVAEVSERVLNQLVVLEPDRVVKEALEAFQDGEPLIIPGAHRNFLQFTLSKFIPLKMKLKITADMFKP